MPELQPIPANPAAAPAPQIYPPARPEAERKPAPEAPPAKAPVESDPRFEVKRYTARYRMDGDRLNIQILDSDGRLVRTVPPNELLRALQGEFRQSRLNWQG